MSDVRAPRPVTKDAKTIAAALVAFAAPLGVIATAAQSCAESRAKALNAAQDEALRPVVNGLAEDVDDLRRRIRWCEDRLLPAEQTGPPAPEPTAKRYGR